jgi:hypothetical protein
MKRAIAILMFFVAAAAMAGERFDQKPLAEGFVSSIDPFMQFVGIDGDQIVIDISTAEFRDALNKPTSKTNLRTGAHIATVLRPGNYTLHMPLSASIVQILQQAVGTVNGAVEAVDLTNNTMTVLGQPIAVNASTYWVGVVPDHDPRSLADVKIGDNVNVTFDGSLDILRAQRIYTLPPTFEDSAIAFTTVVRKIEGDTWTVRTVHTGGMDISTFKVVSGTSIDGFIRPGDTIQVFAAVYGDQVVPRSIELGHVQCPNFEPFPVFTLHGLISSITATSVTITDPSGNTYTITLNDDTVYGVNDPKVGDAVGIQVEKHGETYIARRVDLSGVPFDIDVVDIVKSIDNGVWTIGTHVVSTNSRTAITGDPKPGDKVHLIAITVAPNQALALRIDKQ